MLKVLFFARIREQLGTAEIRVDELPADIDALLDLLENEHGALFGTVLRADNVIVACNFDVVDRNCVLQSGDEIAFYPPVTGG